MNTKMKYLAPELIDLSLRNVQGNCNTNGSSDAALCETGLNAQNDCISNGGTASTNCTAGDNYTADCTPFGSTH